MGSTTLEEVPLPDELHRLACLRDLAILDTPPEPLFDSLLGAAAAACGVPMALLFFVDRTRVFVKSTVGLDLPCELPRGTSPVAAMVRHDDVVVLSEGATELGGGVVARFVAGVPVRHRDGTRVGVLAVASPQAGALAGSQREALLAMAAAVSQALAVRGATQAAEGTRAEAHADATRQAERLACTLEGMGAGTWEWNVQTGETRFNARWAEIVGHTLDELGPTSVDTWLALAHPDDLAASGALLEAHFRGETAMYECEARMRHRDGHWVWVLDRGRVMTWTDDGQPEWMFGTHLDLTERKKQGEALARSEWLLDRTGRLAEVGGWVLELDTMQPIWTAQTRRIHGVSDDFVPDFATAIAFYAPEARPVIEAAVAHCIESGEGWDLELPFVRADGRSIWVRSVGEVEVDGDGVPVRLLGAFQDVTEARSQRERLREVSERLALAAKGAEIGVWEYDLLAGDLVWDEWMFRLFCHEKTDGRAPYTLWSERLHPDDRDEAERRVAEAIEGTRPFEMDFRIVWPDGSVRVVFGCAEVHRAEDGTPLRMIGVNWDVTEERQLQQEILADRANLTRLSQELSEQHERMRITLQSIADAVITTDPAGRVEWMNPVASSLTGWSSSSARGRQVHEVFHVVHEDTLRPAPCPVAACLEAGRHAQGPEAIVLVAADGARFGIEESAAPIRSDDGELLGVVLVFRDVTEQRRISREMTYRATHDPLTGLVNREEFELRLHRALDRAHRDGSTNALLFIDLDQFKIVNDTSGHSVGDRLLQQTARLLAEDIRVSDTLARLGGDEFAIILDHCGQSDAAEIAQRICDRMDAFRFVHDGRTFRIGTSIGLVPVDRTFDDAATVLQAADASCYVAKEAGRNRVHRWRASDEVTAARRGESMWAARIERAIDDDAFVLHAQRIVPIRGDEGLRAEVLVRMRGRDGGLVYPGAFLPSAERFGLSPRLDAWVLEATLGLLRELVTDVPQLRALNVNLSGHSIGDRAFHAAALQLLDRAGRTLCERLCLEITETAAITNMADAKAFIVEARERGVRIALDDFGAGVSSFGYLRQLPVDAIKIDGQFVQRLLDDALDDATVRCFVDIARVLGVSTVAEFVDDPAILERLRELGVDYAQGYLLHKPETLADALTPDVGHRASA
mgnify:CR=1 FL=1